MARKIEIRGKELPMKKVTNFMINEQGAFLLKMKEKFFYCNGVVILKTKDGRDYIFYAGNKNISMGFLFYNANTLAEQEIIFENDFYQAEWQKVAVYFADLDGAFFLFADRQIMNTVGIWQRSCDAYGFKEIEKVALNFISALSNVFAEDIMKNTFYSDGERGLLEVKA